VPAAATNKKRRPNMTVWSSALDVIIILCEVRDVSHTIGFSDNDEARSDSSHLGVSLFTESHERLSI
jgi:hypothetical protein